MPKKGFEDTWEKIRPEVRRGNGRATAKDGSNVGISTSIGIVMTWVVHDVVGVAVPPEVAVAFGTLGGYVVGRLFRY